MTIATIGATIDITMIVLLYLYPRFFTNGIANMMTHRMSIISHIQSDARNAMTPRTIDRPIDIETSVLLEVTPHNDRMPL